LLTSGETSLTINGYTISYFKCKKKGLRHEDPSSLFLFNLVANILLKILNEAKNSGYIKGLDNFEGDNLINLNFTYDTLIFLVLKQNDRCIETSFNRIWTSYRFKN
jgi:hypothetical protein